jgi:hypothetical protein
MEPTVIQPTPNPALVVDPAPPKAAADFVPKKPPNVIFLAAGVVIIAVTLALALSFFGKKPTTSQPGSSSSTATSSSTPSGSAYTNPTYFYTLTLPPTWTEIKHSPLLVNIALFNVEGTATLEITATKSTDSLDSYLAFLDNSTSGTIKSNSSSQVKVGNFDGFERMESWPKVGLQTVVTYAKVSDMLYTFALIPGSGKNAITSDAILNAYHQSLSTFAIIDPSQLGKDLKVYTTKPIAGLSYKPFTVSYPQTWTLTDNSDSKSLALSIYRDNYEIAISQKAIGSAVCLFSDSPAFNGSSGDLRGKQYAEFNTTAGTILRRYFNANMGDKSSMFFCEKQADGPYFVTPLTVGGLVYNVPAKYDPDIIKEMDSIVKTITVVNSSSPSAAK